jgi:hypothetical protein
VVYGPQVGVCRVCGEMTSIHSTASCMDCSGTFHLALRQDIPAKDCGQVWIDEETQTLVFSCSVCLGEVSLAAEPAPPPLGEGRYVRRTGVRATDVLRSKRLDRRSGRSRPAR